MCRADDNEANKNIELVRAGVSAEGSILVFMSTAYS
jgi:hypothetical protein